MLRPAIVTVELTPDLRRRIEPHVFGPLFELAAAEKGRARSLSITQAKELLGVALPQYREMIAGAAPGMAAIGPVPLHGVGTLLHSALHEAALFFRREGATDFRAAQKIDATSGRALRLWQAVFTRRLLPWAQASGRLEDPDTVESLDVVMESVKLWVGDVAERIAPAGDGEIAPATFFLDTETELRATVQWNGRSLALRGRPDALIINRKSRRPEVIEYKLGQQGQMEYQIAQALLYLALVNAARGPGLETARLQLFRLEPESPPDAATEEPEALPIAAASEVREGGPPPVRSGFAPEVESAFAGYVGNAAAVRRLKIECTLARQQDPPTMPVNVMLCGPGGLGKSELARRVARALGAAFVDVPASRVKDVDGFMGLVDAALAVRGQSATDAGTDSGLPRLTYPPVVIFLDEIHLLGRRADLFLNLFEPRERRAVGSKAVADLRAATLLGATTDKGRLPAPFLTRFRMVDLVPYSAEEVAEILRPAFRGHEVDESFLTALARMSRLNPREALQRADELLTHHRFDPSSYPLNGSGLETMASETWQVDEHGLRPSDLAYLRALESGRRGLSALTQMLPVGQDEIVNVIEPYLMQLDFVRTTGSGRELTEIGRRKVRPADDR